ncbi:MAG: hypothetical protein IH968_10335 [Gemmatimonadetes bacterium]|nr:hypothetical protein [Gemmatimonadota bacterium]
MTTNGVPISRTSIAALAVWALSATGSAAGQAGTTPPQTQTDAYTRYELQAPGSEKFRIIYDVSATTGGALYYYNGIREGAEEEVHSVTDLYTGASLEWELVDGRHARANGHPRANENGHFIKVTLARPVPEGGQARIRIDKTYRDADSYLVEGKEIVFSRSLGIRRNSVVLPAGYELVGCNYECQVDTEEGTDGTERIRVSFMNPGPDGVPFQVRGRPLPVRNPRVTVSSSEGRPAAATTTQSVSTAARVDWTFQERAFQNRDITYYLQQPETHSFRLFHDYTESRPGVDRYLNIVRAGSKASDPEATILDTGQSLEIETLRGEEITARGIDIGRPPMPETEVVVIWFDPVQEGRSVRLRIWETYTDPGRYLLHGDELVWDRSFGRARNTVILPEGWYLTTNAIPGVIDQDGEGRTRIRYTNGRPDQIQTFIKARRR